MQTGVVLFFILWSNFEVNTELFFRPKNRKLWPSGGRNAFESRSSASTWFELFRHFSFSDSFFRSCPSRRETSLRWGSDKPEKTGVWKSLRHVTSLFWCDAKDCFAYDWKKKMSGRRQRSKTARALASEEQQTISSRRKSIQKPKYVEDSNRRSETPTSTSARSRVSTPNSSRQPSRSPSPPPTSGRGRRRSSINSLPTRFDL